jgi:hypothetical protein
MKKVDLIVYQRCSYLFQRSIQRNSKHKGGSTHQKCKKIEEVYVARKTSQDSGILKSVVENSILHSAKNKLDIPGVDGLDQTMNHWSVLRAGKNK